MAMIGCERVSTSDQNLEAQAARLREHGCMRVFTRPRRDRQPGQPATVGCLPRVLARRRRPGVTKLDRVGRSVGNLVGWAGELHHAAWT
jgi:hypothetical protein